MKKYYTVKFIDHVANIEKFTLILCSIIILLIIFVLILNLINNFCISGLFITLLLSIILLIALYTMTLLNTTNDNLEQITVTDDKILITFYEYNKKQEVIFNKSEIKRFHTNFSAESFNTGTKIYLDYTTDIIISTINKKFEISCNSSTKNIIKNIFKVAKFIPNFSYSVDKNCIPVIEKSIEKIFTTGKDLSIFEFITFMLTNQKVSIRTKIDTFCCIILITPLVLFLLLMIINIELCDKFIYQYGDYIPYFIIPLIIFITILRWK